MRSRPRGRSGRSGRPANMGTSRSELLTQRIPRHYPLSPLNQSSDTSSAAGTEAPEAFDRPELNDVQRRAVDSLNEGGIAVLEFQDLFGGELWRDAAADIAPFVRETELAWRDAPDRPKKKNELIVRRFFRKAMKDDPELRKTLSLADPWLRIGSSELMLDIVNSYRA